MTHEAEKTLLSLLRVAFPDARSRPTPELARAVGAALPVVAQVQLFGTVLDAPVLEEEASHPSHPAWVLDYWVANTLHRRYGKGAHAFVAPQLLVRTALPPHGVRDQGTVIGVVRGADHLLPSVEAWNAKYSQRLGWLAGRVELLSSARWRGMLFGSVAVYLAHAETGAVGAYALEGGLATGEPAVAWLSGPTREWFAAQSWHQPSSVSSLRHVYEAQARIEGGVPREISINVRPSEYVREPVVRVRSSLSKVDDASQLVPASPATMVAESVMRVAAILDAEGRAEGPAKVLAEFGRELPWSVPPMVRE